MRFSSVLWLMVIDRLSVFLFGFDYLSVFLERKFLFFLLLFFLFRYSIFFLFSVLFFLTYLHQVSVGPPIRKGILFMFYCIYGRYGGAERGRGGFFQIPSLPPPHPMGGLKIWHLSFLCLGFLFFVKLKRHGISLRHYVCVR